MEARGPRVVLVHDWLTGMRGGEKCLEVLCRRWPDAAAFHAAAPARLCQPGHRAPPAAHQLPQRLPGVHRYYRYLLPLMPAAPPALAIAACDLVVSFSHCVAKAVAAAAEACRTSATASRRCATPGTCGKRTSARARRGVKARLARPAARLAAALGPPHRRRRDAFYRHQPRPCSSRIARVLWPRQHRHLSAGRHRFLLPGRRAARGLLPGCVRVRSLQAARPGHRGVQPRWAGRCVVIGSGQDERGFGAGGTDGPFPRLAARRSHPRPSAPLPGFAVSRRRGFRHRPGRSPSVRSPVIAFGRGGATETVIPPDRCGPPPHRPVVRRTNHRGAGRG